jgi:hypothetical protein
MFQAIVSVIAAKIHSISPSMLLRSLGSPGIRSTSSGVRDFRGERRANLSHKFYRGVTRVLQGCYKGVTRTLQGRYKDVTRMLQGCYKDVIRMSGT